MTAWADKTEIELANLLRWEEDGGKVIQLAEAAKIVRFRIDEPGIEM